jgi:hypothetical protein
VVQPRLSVLAKDHDEIGRKIIRKLAMDLCGTNGLDGQDAPDGLLTGNLGAHCDQ